MLSRILGSFDMFGSPFRFKMSQSDQHVTSLGGLISIVINILGFIYAIYMLVGWVEGRFVPSIQDSQYQITDKKQYTYYYNPLRIQVQNINSSIDQFQFSSSADVFPFKTGKQVDRNVTQLSKMKSNSNCNTDDYFMCLLGNGSNMNKIIGQNSSTSSTQIVRSLNVSQSQNNGSQSLTMIVYPCKVKCSLANLFRVKFDVFTEDYDIKSNSIRQMQKSFAFLSTSSQTLNIQFIVRLQKIKVADGGLVQQLREYEIISDVQVIPTILTGVKISEVGICRAFVFLDTVYNEKRISEVSFSQILAQVGSVFSVLYMVQHLLRLFSSKQMQNVLQLEVLKIYFPTLNEKRIDLDFFGKIKRIHGMSEQQQNYFLHQNLQLSQNQLNVVNLFRQIKTLQLAISKLIPNHQIFHLIHSGDDPFEYKDSLMGGRDSVANKYNLMELFCPETSKHIYDGGGGNSIYYDGSH